ncbi:phage holin family protein [Pseudarthrobacter sp. N5]|uniref:phage holin family protein n=1 Tax=Pseudarthrobacter sp. N5 TaxID=3418416 RepID=UPI003CEDF54D
MSGRHSGRTIPGPRISALPKTLKLVFRLLPRQLNDEIALAKVEIKRKGIQLGVAAAFFAVALVFIAFLVIGLIVAAIMGLATIMPAWLAALSVCGLFLLIALLGALIGLRKFKKSLPLIPEDSLRGLKHDLGIAKEGSAYNPALLDPSTPEAKAAKAAKAEAEAQVKAEKAAKAKKTTDIPAPTEAELRSRLKQRRQHLTGVRDDLGRELDVRTQGQAFLGMAKDRLDDGRELLKESSGRAAEKLRPFVGPSRSGSDTSSDGGAGSLDGRWKPLIVLAASSAVLVVLLRRLFKN